MATGSAKPRSGTRKRTGTRHRTKRVNLALQGGGAHGAFTWGVLDKVLEDGRLEIDGISATSAGAMNAAVLAAGFATGGHQGARVALEAFWRDISAAAAFSPIQRHPMDRMLGQYRLDNSPGYLAYDLMTRLMSPYQLNPLNQNPLRDVLERTIDFDAVRHASGIRLFVSATCVETGKVRVFENKEMCATALLASACLPMMFQAVEHEGLHYYDGGFMGNPCIFPLIYGTGTTDVLIVQINPLVRDGVPTNARDIHDRVNEITFNSSLMREMRAVHFVTRLIDSGNLDASLYKRMNIHMVEDEEELKKHGASSKLVADLDFLLHLRDVGRGAAAAWLDSHFDKVGVESTIDLVDTFL